MKKTRFITVSVALFWITLGLLVCYGATRLGVGTVTEPGSGFIFFWSGLILAVLSLMSLAESFGNDWLNKVCFCGAKWWRGV